MELLSSSLPGIIKCIVVIECQSIACGELGEIERGSVFCGKLLAG